MTGPSIYFLRSRKFITVLWKLIGYNLALFLDFDEQRWLVEFVGPFIAVWPLTGGVHEVQNKFWIIENPPPVPDKICLLFGLVFREVFASLLVFHELLNLNLKRVAFANR